MTLNARQVETAKSRDKAYKSVDAILRSSPGSSS